MLQQLFRSWKFLQAERDREPFSHTVIRDRQHIPTALPKDDRLVGSLDEALIEKPRPPHELNPRVPLKLSELIMQCVEAMPEKRPADMDQVADRLNLIHGMILASRASAGIAASDSASIPKKLSTVATSRS